ncbi:MAG TPA: pyridoxamine 5'-phosphate oxidase family protein [Acidimicrobiales bacterium]|nr:pyridoxamine 5'-phosphate oxidase family protein [Acidimicrobiales bacterium]
MNVQEVQEVLDDPVAQELLASSEPAKLAYTWKDGTPRVVPIWFQWTGSELVVASPVNAPKVSALESRPDVAVTIDSNSWPYHVLLLRGKAKVERTDHVVPEYASAAQRYAGPDFGQAWTSHLEASGAKFARIGFRPTFAAIIDCETRFPSATAPFFKSFLAAT